MAKKIARMSRVEAIQEMVELKRAGHDQSSRYQVQRPLQAFPECGWSSGAAVVVWRPPFCSVRLSENDGLVEQFVRGWIPVVDGDGVDDGLEGRSRLPFHLDCPIVLPFFKIPASNHGKDVAIGRI